MPEYIKIDATKRTVVGKQVKQLRREGMVPAIVYGPEREPLSLTLDKRELRQTLLTAGGTQIIEIVVDGETIPTLAREVQRDPIYGEIMHVDFYQVSMTRSIRADVPVILTGDNELVNSGAAVLVHGLNALVIEALPADLPPQIEVDITGLAEIGDQIVVSDLVLPKGTEAIADDTELIVKLDYPRLEEEEEEGEEEELLFEEAAEVEVIRESREEEDEEE